MKEILANKGHWLTGTAIALSGVILVRLVAPNLSGMLHQAVAIIGYLISLIGICIFARRPTIQADV
jgi:hypothetical protein